MQMRTDVKTGTDTGLNEWWSPLRAARTDKAYFMFENDFRTSPYQIVLPVPEIPLSDTEYLRICRKAVLRLASDPEIVSEFKRDPTWKEGITRGVYSFYRSFALFEYEKRTLSSVLQAENEVLPVI